MPTTIPVFVLLGAPAKSDSHRWLELKPQFKWLPVKLYLGTSNKRSGIWPVRPFESSCLQRPSQESQVNNYPLQAHYNK
nr:hypothetical protein Iba_scaffold43708CG0010 [Ipomoea batatas]GMD53418.1 hypothetical protein Iba_chr11cCG2470 [Ipomoea batatas]